MKILPDDHPSLHTPCDFPVTKEDFASISFNNTLTEMLALMRESSGIGLAANQVGFRKRFFVAYLSKRYLACCNPTWKPHPSARLENVSEMCLSLMEPKEIPRWTSIIASWDNWDGKRMTEIFEGIDAQCFQHECDHLDGIPFSEMPSKAVSISDQ